VPLLQVSVFLGFYRVTVFPGFSSVSFSDMLLMTGGGFGFHFVLHFEECSPSVTVNSEFIFWEPEALGRKF
jgi:hypothetical protein